MPKLLIKILLGLTAIVVLLTIVRWFGAMDGVTTIELNGYEAPLRTNVFFGLTMLLFAIVWLGVYIMRRGIGGFYQMFDFFHRRKHARGLDALSRTLIALAESDGPRALRYAQKAERLLENPDLTRLVTAQAAKLAGNEKLAGEYYELMAADPDTEFLGLQGLLGQAIKEEKPARALRLAERAHALRPKQGEMLDKLFELQTAKGDWVGARRTIEASVRSRRLTRDVGDRRLAVLHYAEAEAREAEGDAASALRQASAAVGRSPGLAPAAAMAARLQAQAGEVRPASRLLAKAWRQSPHPDLAAAFASLAPAESPAERLKRFEQLFRENPAHEETRLLKAELAIAGDELQKARDALGDLAEAQPTARACALMAAIEQGQGASDAIVRGWLSKAAAAPRGAQWVCDNCGSVSAGWSARCGTCGAFDTLSWRRTAGLNGVEDAALFPLLATPSGANGASTALKNGAAAPAALPAGATSSGSGGATASPPARLG